MAGYKVNTNANTGNAMRSVQFFNLYFSSFKKLLAANLLLLPFNLLAIGFTAFTYTLFGGINFAAAPASLIILNVGMSGVTLICRYICTGTDFKVFTAFKKGFKENSLRFLFHGLVFYIIYVVSYLSIAMYYNGTKSSSVFWIPLVITGLIVLFALFASYYLNIMTATMDISLKDIYRNCALFSFGELKNNVLTTVALIIMSAMIFTIEYIINDMWIDLIIIAVLQLFIIPSTVQYIITFYTYNNMVAVLDQSQRDKKKTDETDSQPEVKRPTIDKQEAEDISRLTPDSKDEFIFYNGRMIKRSEVEKMLEMDNDNQ